jgi:hypothetical protein
MSIDEKINLKGNLIFHTTATVYFHLVNNNRIALAPYYNERLKKQRDYLSYRETVPDYVKEMEQH